MPQAMKTWKVTVAAKHRPLTELSKKDQEDAALVNEIREWNKLVGVEQETLLTRKGVDTKADVQNFVHSHWKHLTYVRCEDVTPPNAEEAQA